MSYADCEDGVIATLQTLTTYFPKAVYVRSHDFAVLDTGITKGCAVTLPGAVGQAVDTPAFERSWEIQLGLYYRFSTWVKTLDNFVAMREAVIHKFDMTPNLGTSGKKIYNTLISSTGIPEEVSRKGGTGPVFLCQWFSVMVYQQVSV